MLNAHVHGKAQIVPAHKLLTVNEFFIAVISASVSIDMNIEAIDS